MSRTTGTKLLARLDDFVKQANDEPVVVTWQGKPVAVLVALEGAAAADYQDRPAALLLPVHDQDELETTVMSHSKRLHRILERAEQQIREGKGIPHDEFWRRVHDRNAKKERKRPRKKTG